MIDFVKLIQTRAFARQDGAILGAVWIVSFACTMLAIEPKYGFLGLLANILTLSTPFVVARRLKSFRDYALDGAISFRRGLFYCIQTFFNATLLLTVVQYLWFRFMDIGPFMTNLQATYQMMLQTSNMTEESINTLLEAISMMKPIAWASMFMITDLVVGAILSPIIAGLMARNIKKQPIIKQQ